MSPERIDFKIDEHLLERIDKKLEDDKRYKNRSNLIRQLLENWLKKEEDLIRDLRFYVKKLASEDTPLNPIHMKLKEKIGDLLLEISKEGLKIPSDLKDKIALNVHDLAYLLKE